MLVEELEQLGAAGVASTRLKFIIQLMVEPTIPLTVFVPRVLL